MEVVKEGTHEIARLLRVRWYLLAYITVNLFRYEHPNNEIKPILQFQVIDLTLVGHPMTQSLKI